MQERISEKLYQINHKLESNKRLKIDLNNRQNVDGKMNERREPEMRDVVPKGSVTEISRFRISR